MKKNKSVAILLTIMVLAIVGFVVYNNKGERASGNVIRIGAILPLTGNRAEYGRDSLEALRVAEQLYADKLRANGDTIEIIVEDSKSTPQGAINGYQAIRAKYPSCKIMFTQGSSIASVISDFTARDRVIQISNAGNAIPATTNPFFFACSIDEKSAAEMYDKQVKRGERCLVFYLDDDLGTTVFKEMTRLGGNKYFGIPFTHTAESRDIVAKSHFDSYDTIAVVGLGPNVVRIIKTLRESGYNGVILGAETVITEENKKLLAGFTKNLYCLTTTQLSAGIRNVFLNRFGRRVLSISHTTTYDAAVLMISASIEHFKRNGDLSDVEKLRKIMTSEENIKNAPCLKSIENQKFKYNMEFLPL